MIHPDLRERLERYGADMTGIDDRFMGDGELYESCLSDFLSDSNFALLEQSLASENYKEAFAAAHAIKGISANLGLSPFYESVCELVEVLRPQNGANVAVEYTEMLRQYDIAHALFADEAEKEAEPESEPQPLPTAEPVEDKRQTPREKAETALRSATVKIIISSIVGLVVIAAVFITTILLYVRDNRTSNANRLAEISSQMALQIEERLRSDWNTIYSMRHAITGNAAKDEALFDYLVGELELCDAEYFTIYTKNNYAIRSDGMVLDSETARYEIADTLYFGDHIHTDGAFIIFSIPVDSDEHINVTYNGEPIVALSISRDMTSLFNDMEYFAYEGQARLYLTRENGEVISLLSHPDATAASNILHALNERECTAIFGDIDDVHEIPYSTGVSVFLTEADGHRSYCATLPIESHNALLRLFYLLPAKVVEGIAFDFMNATVATTVFALLVFGLIAFLLTTYLSKMRKALYDTIISTRESTVETIMQETDQAFALLTPGKTEPDYYTHNAEKLLGEEFLLLDISDEGEMSFRSPSGKDSRMLREINRQLSKWDGEGTFFSNYIEAQGNDGIKPKIEIQVLRADTVGTQYICVARDASHVFERERAVGEALELAENATQEKSRFLSNMSHDIRTPLNAIINVTDFALKSVDDKPKLMEYLHTITASSEHLLRIVNDVLDMSRIENGKMTIEQEPFDLLKELNSASEIARRLCESRKQMFITDFRGVKQNALIGDRTKLSQILMNLLDNASKFTPDKGAVRFVATEIPALKCDITTFRFVIEDTGMGIEREAVKRVFEPFYRADDRRVSGITGTGLGLPICHNYVVAMGGTIKCDSEINEGTTFTVELSFGKAGSTPISSKPVIPDNATPFKGMRCLLCEDNPINRMIAETMLERLGFSVDTAQDGAGGVVSFKNSYEGYYNVIYMDISMPHMDGYEATVAIRESGHPQAKKIPIIAMTANVFADDVERSRISGMDGHIGKPISSANIVEETLRALEIKR